MLRRQRSEWLGAEACSVFECMNATSPAQSTIGPTRSSVATTVQTHCNHHQPWRRGVSQLGKLWHLVGALVEGREGRSTWLHRKAGEHKARQSHCLRHQRRIGTHLPRELPMVDATELVRA